MTTKKIAGIVGVILGAGLVVVVLTIAKGPLSQVFAGAQKDQVFTKAGMTITLPGDFTEQELMSQTAAYVSQDSVVTALKEEFTIFEQAGISTDISLSDYADLVITNNAVESEVFDHNGLTCFTYEKLINGKDTTYFASVYKGTDAYWLVQFACATEDYAAYEAKFYQWAESVKVS